MKKTIVSTNWLNKVIAAMMLMAIAFATPAKAGNKKPNNHGKNDKVVVVNNDKKDSHFDKVDKRTSHFYAHKTHASRPDMKTCTVHLSRFDSPRAAMVQVGGSLYNGGNVQVIENLNFERRRCSRPFLCI